MHDIRAIVIILSIGVVGILNVINTDNRFDALEKKLDFVYDSPPPPKPEPVVKPEPEPKPRALVEQVSNEAMECLRANIYWEARNESTQGGELVAVVTINRMKRRGFPNDICGVVKYTYKGSYAFSWYGDGKSDTPNLAHPAEKKAWDKSMDIAINVVNGVISIPNDSPLREADHYHRDDVSPYWMSSMPRVGQVGRHIAYQAKF